MNVELRDLRSKERNIFRNGREEEGGNDLQQAERVKDFAASHG